MEAYKLTLKQYQKQEFNKFKQTKFYTMWMKQTKERRNNFFKSQLEKYKNEWYELVVEYGRYNTLENKIIYSFDREYGRKNLLYAFRANSQALINWINSDAIGL